MGGMKKIALPGFDASRVYRKRAQKELRRVKESRDGRQFVLVQIGPKTWIEKEVKPNK